MAMVFCDGFDCYTAIAQKWTTTQTGVGTIVIDPTAGRDGRGAAHCTRAFLSVPLPDASQYTIGFAFKGDGGQNAGIVLFTDAGNGTLIKVNWNTDGTFSLIRGSDGVTLATSTATLGANVWAYLELKYKASLAISTGDVELRLNGTAIISLAAGTASAGAGHTTIQQCDLGSNSGIFNAFQAWIDDVVVLDSTESFWGDCVVEGHLPNGSGTYSQFSPSGDSPNYKCVDDPAPDGDTTYVASSDINNRDSYVFPGLAQSVQQVRAVQVCITTKKVGSTGIGLTPFFRNSGIDYDQSRQTPTTSYTTLLSQYLVNPATGAAWLASEIAAIEAGMKVVA